MKNEIKNTPAKIVKDDKKATALKQIREGLANLRKGIFLF